MGEGDVRERRLEQNRERWWNNQSRQRVHDKNRQISAEIRESMPQLKQLPPSTSTFACQVYAEVFKALSAYNIRFKAEFNYLRHQLYQRTSGKSECGLRADLLVEVELDNGQKPLIIVIEAQGK